MKRSFLFLITTVLILLFTYGSAFAITLTGCLKPDGKIIRVKEGTEPKKPCKNKKWQQITWGQGPAGADGLVYIGAAPITVDNIQRLIVDASGGTFTLALGGQTTAPLAFGIDAAGLVAALEALSTVDAGNVGVTLEDGSFRISFVEAQVDQGLTVDGALLLPSPGSSANLDPVGEIGLGAFGANDGDLLEWDAAGANWIAMPPRSINIKQEDNMQPWLGLNYVIATVGVFPSRNGADPLLAEIMLFAGNFNPRGWAFCNGQLLSISQNSALFSLLGTNFGGDGRSTFGLPDLRGRVPVGSQGNSTGPGLTRRNLGAKGGVETHFQYNR
jgi:microcystin-dependent protein